MLADLAPDALINAALSGDTTLMALVSAVTEHPNTNGDPFPLVTFTPYGNGSDLTTIDGTRVVTSGLWLVRVIGEAGYADLAPAYSRVDELLQAARAVNSYGTVYGLVRQSPFRLTEVSAGVTRRALGGIYRCHYGA